MSQISLKKYVDEVDQQIQNGEIEAAIAHCRHILTRYPMYLPAYRSLGHACLEKGDYSYAAHFFQSILSADPEEADAWMNLAMLSDDLGELEQATWLMERAFEVNPGNAEVRSLLKGLYHRRDGVERMRIKLTAGALARMYATGGFYKRAIDELEKLLKRTHGLAPLYVAYLEVALAEALWNMEGMVPLADRIARSLLEKLPNCLKANLILGQILWSAGKEGQAAPYIDVALSLDPEGRVAYGMFGDRSPVPLTGLELPYLEYPEEKAVAEPFEVTAAETEDLSWLDRVGQITEVDQGLAPSAEGEGPDWLQAWPAEETAAPVVAEEAESPVDEEEAVEEAERVPTWLSDLQSQDAEPMVPDWLRTIQEESMAEVGEEEGAVPGTPDWLQELQGKEEPTGEAVEPVAAIVEEEEGSDWLQQLRPETVEQVPDWLRELESDITEPPPAVTGEAALEVEPVTGEEEEISDWLSRLQPEVEEPLAALAEEAAPAELVAEEEEEIPDWLSRLQPEAEEPLAALAEEAAPAELVAEEEEEIPDWLRELQPETEESLPAVAEEVAPAEPVAEEEIPEWLRELRPQAEELAAPVAEQAAPAIEPVTEEREELSDWLSRLKMEARETLPTVAEQAAPAEPVAGEGVPEWVQELRPQAEEQPPPTPDQVAPTAETVVEEEAEVPDWLRELRPQAEELATSIAEEAAAEAEPVTEEEEEIPDWLSRLQPELEELFPARGEEATPEGELEAGEEREIPDWLSRLQPELGELFPTAAEEAAAVAEPAAEEEEEVPDWLSRLQPEAEESLSAVTAEEALKAEPVTEEEEEISDWLSQLQPEAEEPFLTLAEEEEEVPDWLSRLQPEVEEEALKVEPVTEEEVEVPGWLQELQPEVEEPSLTVEEGMGVMAGEIVEPGVVELPPPVEGMPGWLVDLEAEIREEAGLATAVEKEAAIAVEPQVVAEPETAVEPEVAVEPEMVEPPSPVEEMPGWLMDLETAIGEEAGLVTAVEEEAAIAVEPEVVAEPEVVVEPEAAVEPEMVELPPPVEGMPGWLVDLEAEIGGEAGLATAVEEEAVIAVEPEVVAEPEMAVEPEVVVEPEAAVELEEVPEAFVELEAEAGEGVSAVAVEETPVQEEAAPVVSEAGAVPDWLAELEQESGEIDLRAEPLPDVEDLEWFQELEQLEVMTPFIEAQEVEAEAPAVAEERLVQDLLTEAQEPEEGALAVVSEEQVQLEAERALMEEEPGYESTLVEEYRARLAMDPDEHETRMALARVYLREGALGAAAREYERLTQVVALADTLVSDLEEAVQDYPDHHVLHRVLGDAYMRAGQFSEALEAYRQALKKL